MDFLFFVKEAISCTDKWSGKKLATNGNDYGIIYLLVYVKLPLKANTVPKTAINELKLGYVF